MFSDYLKRQFAHRANAYEKINISKSTFYRHLNDPTQITLGELRSMMIVGELDEEEVISYICRRKK